MKRSLRLLLLRLLALPARPLVRRSSLPPSSVLYVKPDHLGDVLLATPALAALRRRLPGARVTALVGPWSRVVLERNPDVDTLLTCPFPGFTRSAKGAPWRPYLALLRYALLLRRGRYDLAIVGRDDHWWGAALALLAGVPRRVGFAVPECRPFLTDALPWDPRVHVTAQGLALVEAATADKVTRRHGEGETRRRGDTEKGRHGEGETRRRGDTETRGTAATRSSVLSPQSSTLGPQSSALSPQSYVPAPEDRAWADDWLAAQGVGTGERLVVIHPGTGGPAKLWFPERWAAVADALQAAGARVVVTGGPGEEALVDEVTGRSRRRPLTLAGRTTLGQLAALLRRAALVLGVDSGPLHLAAAQQVPTLHLYGPGDAERFGPWGDPARHVVVRADLWCSPCGVFDACPRGLARPECMERIAVELVAERALRLLEGAR